MTCTEIFIGVATCDMHEQPSPAWYLYTTDASSGRLLTDDCLRKAMTNSSFASALHGLQVAAKLTGDGSVRALDSALVKVTEYRDPLSIGPLLLLLNDSAECDEGMFSLIHAAEAFDDQTYVHALLEVLPELRAAAPKWASIALMRALNNDATRDALVREMRQASVPIKQAAKWLCERINERSGTFTSKTLGVRTKHRCLERPMAG